MTNKSKNIAKQTLFIMVISLISLISIGAYALISAKGGGLKSMFFAKTEKKGVTPEQVQEKVPAFNYLDFAKAELSVKGLVNSTDIYKVKTSLNDMQGIEKVLIDLPMGTVEVFFDDTRLTNADMIAKQIKENTGFETQLLKVVGKNEMDKGDDYNRKIKKLYAVTVNDFDISMADFNQEVKMFKSRYRKRYGDDIFNSPSSSQILESIKAQSIQSLINDAMVRSNIARSDFILKKDVIEKEVNAMLKRSALTLEEGAKRAGYENRDYFYQKLETQVLVKQYVDNEVFKSSADNAQKGKLYNQWVSNINSSSKIKYHNAELEATVIKAKACTVKGCGDPTCE